ncbi:MAG: TrmH family RNA methyltransferase [Bacilli bacterium]
MVKKYKKDSSVSYTLGTTLTFELIYNRSDFINKIYIHPNLKKDETYDKLVNLCHKKSIIIEESIKPFNILSDKENCYVIGEFNKYEDKLEDENHIVLVNPSDGGNLGTIMRSALGFGINNIAIVRPGVDHFNPKVVRSSMGACFKVHIEYFDSFDEYYDKYRNHEIYTLMLQASTNLSMIDKPKNKYSLVFGNEGTGLPQEFLHIGTPVIIKHSHNIDSLNLPIAVSITLYEFTKERFKE